MADYFTPALFKFLNDLEANNDRAWFNANKDRYIESVQEPTLAFISDFGLRLGEDQPSLVGLMSSETNCRRDRCPHHRPLISPRP